MKIQEKSKKHLKRMFYVVLRSSFFQKWFYNLDTK